MEKTLWISWYSDYFKMVFEAVPFSCRCPTPLSSTVIEGLMYSGIFKKTMQCVYINNYLGILKLWSAIFISFSTTFCLIHLIVVDLTFSLFLYLFFGPSICFLILFWPKKIFHSFFIAIFFLSFYWLSHFLFFFSKLSKPCPKEVVVHP